MAVAAGVVIMAITNSANDRLRGQQTDQDSACEDWELHDIGLEAAGRGGPQANGGIQSSAIGCRRVCYVRFRHNTTSLTTPPNDINLNGTLGGYAASNPQAELYFSRADAHDTTGSATADSGSSVAQRVSFPVAGKKSLDPNGNNKTTVANVDIAQFEGNSWPDTHSISVHASGNYCIVEDDSQTTANQREVLRSET